MAKFTLLELHLGDGTVQVGPASIGGRSGGGADRDDGGDEARTGGDETRTGADEVESGGRGKLLTALGVLLLVALLALAVWKLAGEEVPEELEELDDLA